MSLLIWPIALVAFLAWSAVAWLLYGASGALTAFATTALGGVLSADLGPWGAWIMASLGWLIQIGVVAVWAIVGLLILAAPIILSRLKARKFVPSFGGMNQRRQSDYPDRDHHGRRDRDTWKSRMRETGSDLEQLRFLTADAVDRYRQKKFKKKRWQRDDDDD